MHSIRFICQLFLLSVLFVLPATASVIDAVVNIEFNKVRAWDDGYNSSGVGTGFVIDAEQGLILTNKHILNVAPVIAYAEFSNKKSIPLVPIYRDPVHDFGVFKYDPALLDGLQVTPIELVADAEIGESIRLYGNDGGEALSIIEGVLSRTERPAPNYESTNTDVNTFYYQAALGSSGGSSGSPILNSNNQAIAINAGGRRDTAAAFFLPMRIILPTLNKLLSGARVTRGTLQTTFQFEPYNQLRKTGWDNERIASAKQRLPAASGRLMVEQIVPDSPAANWLEVGDLLLAINQQPLADFYQLEATLNANVGQTITIEVERMGKVQQGELPVSDLFQLVPDRFIEYGRAVMIEVGLSVARLFNVPVGGVMVVDPGPLFGSQNIRPYAIIDEINNQPIANLDSLLQALNDVGFGNKFSLRYRYPYANANQEYKQVRDYANWFDNQDCRSRLGHQLWACKTLEQPLVAENNLPLTSRGPVSSALVDLEVFRPLAVNMNNDVIRRGEGVVVDSKRGLIITDRSLIDSTLSEVQVSYNNGEMRSAKVLAIHPYLNMVLVQVEQQDIEFAPNTIPQVADFKLLGLSELDVISKSSFMDFRTKSDLGWPVVAEGKYPFDTYAFSIQPDNFSFYVDEQNRLAAIIPAFAGRGLSDQAIPAPFIYDFVQKVINNQTGLFRPEDRFKYISYGQALELGLSDVEHQVSSRYIAVDRAEQLANTGLLSGDVLLNAEDKALTALNDYYLSLSAKSSDLTLLRNGESLDQTVQHKFVSFNERDEVLFWAGAIIHELPINIMMPEGPSDTCLRVGVRYFGAPLYSAKASGSYCVYSIDGVRVETLREVKDIVFNKRLGEYTQLKIIDLEKNFQLFEYKLTEDPYYWPTIFYHNGAEAWHMQKANTKLSESHE